MAKIQIWGDSWGEPARNKGVTNPKNPNFTYNGHSSVLLTYIGYDVENIAEAGYGNLRSIERVLNDQVNMTNPDWVIWFHTEIPRDIKQMNNWKYDIDIHHTADIIYKKANEAISKLNAKLIFVEGQSVAVQPEFSQHITPTLFVTDWRSELLNKKMPESQIISSPGLLEISSDTIEYKNKLLDDISVIIHSMKSSDAFPDNCHPGDKQHQALANKIHNFIQNYKE